MPLKMVIDSFPDIFGLKAFPGRKFRIDVNNSYVDGDTIVIYLQRLWILKGKKIWRKYISGSPEEFSEQLVIIQGSTTLKRRSKGGFACSQN